MGKTSFPFHFQTASRISEFLQICIYVYTFVKFKIRNGFLLESTLSVLNRETWTIKQINFNFFLRGGGQPKGNHCLYKNSQIKKTRWGMLITDPPLTSSDSLSKKMWHLTHDMWHTVGVNILKKIQLPSPYSLGLTVS